jgi:hypothetical protein
VSREQKYYPAKHSRPADQTMLKYVPVIVSVGLRDIASVVGFDIDDGRGILAKLLDI